MPRAQLGIVAFRPHPEAKNSSPYWPLLFGRGPVLNVPREGHTMIDPLNRVERDLKTAEEFFEFAKNGTSPFNRAYKGETLFFCRFLSSIMIGPYTRDNLKSTCIIVPR